MGQKRERVCVFLSSFPSVHHLIAHTRAALPVDTFYVCMSVCKCTTHEPYITQYLLSGFVCRSVCRVVGL